MEKLITLYAIGHSIAWINTFTVDESYLEDLKWMEQHFLNSINQELCEEVESCLKHEFPSEEWGIPLSFDIMIEKYINLSETAIDILKENIKTYKISSVPSENIEIVVSRFLYAFKRLKNNNAVTPTLIKSLFNVFQTTLVPDYNKLVGDWERDFPRKYLRPPYEEVIRETK